MPLPNYAERILGYFRDPDVAFVVGPQCYANDETFVTRAAESQQFPFHSLIQRAANRYNAAMLVGTNNAIRISALRAVGGLSDSITEDMATGLKFHTRRNPASGRRWKSVYTPDVLAVGEGPSSWGDFFSQQMRWSRGTFEVLLKEMIFRLPRLSPGRALHYILITTFYPSMAIGWVLGAVNACLFLALGVQGVVVPVQLWLALYIDATAFQLWVYLRNRRYNVSPYEPEGSSGIKGMLMSIFAAPIFAASLIATMLRLPAKFVVTPKGLSSSAGPHPDLPPPPAVGGCCSSARSCSRSSRATPRPAVLLWPAVALAACLAPPVLCLVERIVGRQPAIDAAPPAVLPDGRSGITTESLERAALDALLAAGTPPAARPARRPCPPASGPVRRTAPGPSPRATCPPAGSAPPRSPVATAGPGRRVPRSRPRADAGAARTGPPRTGPPRTAGPPRAVATHATTPPSWTRAVAALPRSRPTPGPAPQPGQPGPQGQPGQPPQPGPQPGSAGPAGPPASRRPARPGRPPSRREHVPPAAPRDRVPGPRPRPAPEPVPGARRSVRASVRPPPSTAAATSPPRPSTRVRSRRPPAPRPDGRPGETPVGRPTPPSPAPRPDAAPGRGPDRTPRPGPRRERPPMLFSSPAELEAEGTEAVMPVSVGSSIGNETAKRHDGRDGGSRAPDTGSVNAPTVAVRVVALAAVAGPARQGPAGVPPDIDGRRTEAS